MRQLAKMNGMEHVSKVPAGKCKEAKPAIGRIINVSALIAFDVSPIAIRWWDDTQTSLPYPKIGSSFSSSPRHQYTNLQVLDQDTW